MDEKRRQRKNQKATIAQLKIKFLEYYRELPIIKLAAASIGRTDDTLSLWRAQDSDFSEAIDTAKAEWAKEKVRGVRSKEWLLERILKEQFAPRQELTGAEGKELIKQTLDRLETDYDKLGQQAIGQMVEDNTSLQNKDEEGRDSNIQSEPSTEASSLSEAESPQEPNS